MLVILCLICKLQLLSDIVLNIMTTYETRLICFAVCVYFNCKVCLFVWVDKHFVYFVANSSVLKSFWKVLKVNYSKSILMLLLLDHNGLSEGHYVWVLKKSKSILASISYLVLVCKFFCCWNSKQINGCSKCDVHWPSFYFAKLCITLTAICWESFSIWPIYIIKTYKY